MRLSVREILHAPGEEIRYQFLMDLSAEETSRPITEPVAVTGTVHNHAGALVLRARARTKLHTLCDRCGKPLVSEQDVPFEYLLSTSVEDENNDEILVLDDGEVDITEAARTAFLLGMDTKYLCREDCRGICAGCGVNLNEGECRCKKACDPRLQVLAQLLEGEERE